MLISIHTTRKVVTQGLSLFFQQSKHFNPHHPQGGDYHVDSPPLGWIISIHTTRKVVTHKC